MTARGSRGSSLTVSVLVTLLAVAGAITLAVRLPGRASEMAAGAALRQRGAARPVAGERRSPDSRRPGPAPASPGRQTGPDHPRPRRPPSSHAAPATPGAAPRRRRRTPRRRPPSPPPAQQVLALINQARAQAGLPAYTVSSGLDTSAAGIPR